MWSMGGARQGCRLGCDAQAPRHCLGREEVGEDCAVGFVAVLQPEEREDGRADVGVVRPGAAGLTEVLDAGAYEAEPGATDVFGGVTVTPREVIVDAGRE